MNFQAWPARRQTKTRELGSSWVSPAGSVVARPGLPWKCLVRREFSLVCQHVRSGSKGPDLEHTGMCFGGSSAWCLGDPEGCQSKGHFVEDIFAPTTVLAKATDSSSRRVSGHIQEICVVNSVESNTALGLPHPTRAPEHHFISHLQLNRKQLTLQNCICFCKSKVCAEYHMELVAMGNISVCQNFKIQPSVSKHPTSTSAPTKLGTNHNGGKATVERIGN